MEIPMREWKTFPVSPCDDVDYIIDAKYPRFETPIHL